MMEWVNENDAFVMFGRMRDGETFEDQETAKNYRMEYRRG